MNGTPKWAHDEHTLKAPRILCLHGGGTNAEVMRLQCRSISRSLSPHFRLVYPDAPFLCPPHPGILPVYESYGPFRRWLRWQHSQPEIDDDTVLEEIEYQLRSAMEDDDKLGATGEWVGLLGFSQGSKVVSSMLYESQIRMEEAAQAVGRWTNRTQAPKSVEGFAGGNWKFGVCMAGRPPLISLRHRTAASPLLQRPGDISELGFVSLPQGLEPLKMPTIHVHGLADAGLPHHRQLFDEYCEPGTTKLIEWDGDHRLPIKSADVMPVVEAIMETAKSEGVI